MLEDHGSEEPLRRTRDHRGDGMTWLPPEVLTMLARVGLAFGVGIAIGFEREAARKPAGLRTIAAVSLGSCIFALLGQRLILEWSTVENIRLDPIRVVAGLIGGIGFLGAGAIIESRGSVEGVTTAATIWVTGAIGLACGIGYYWLAVVGTVGALIILRGLGWLEHRLLHRGDGDEGRSEGGLPSD
jgi:putative Mg2+ transporter-C (MgtC) family protein